MSASKEEVIEKDSMREMCVAQGYVPTKCKLPGIVIFALVKKGESPCDGCNHNRSECGGKPRK